MTQAARLPSRVQARTCAVLASFGKQRQRRGEGTIAPQNAATRAGGAPSDSNGRGRIGVRDAFGKLAQQPFVTPSVREQLRPARHQGNEQVERVRCGDGNTTTDPERAIGRFRWHWSERGVCLYPTHFSPRFSTDF